MRMDPVISIAASFVPVLGLVASFGKAMEPCSSLATGLHRRWVSLLDTCWMPSLVTDACFWQKREGVLYDMAPAMGQAVPLEGVSVWRAVGNSSRCVLGVLWRLLLAFLEYLAGTRAVNRSMS